MSTVQVQRELLNHLEAVGDPRETQQWADGEPNYVALFGLTEADVPALMAIARQWVDRTDWPDDPDDLTIYAPIHAWRALGQLRAASVVEPLIELMADMDEEDHDWHFEEFPELFGLIGPTALTPLAQVVQDTRRQEMLRVCAADGLKHIAKRHPDVREEVVTLLTDTLNRGGFDDMEMNSFAVSYLLDLGATESADAIERAFAEDRVNAWFMGNWNEVRQEYNLPSTGRVPADLADQTCGWERERHRMKPKGTTVITADINRWPSKRQKKQAKRKAAGKGHKGKGGRRR